MNRSRFAGFAQYAAGLAVGAFWAGKPIGIAVAYALAILVCALAADAVLRVLATRWRTAWGIAGAMVSPEMSFARWTDPRWWIATRLFLLGRACNKYGGYIGYGRSDR